MKIGDILICKSELDYNSMLKIGYPWKIKNITIDLETGENFFAINLIGTIYNDVFYENDILKYFNTLAQIRKQKLLKLDGILL